MFLSKAVRAALVLAAAFAGVEAGSCQDFCVRCKDGSTVWMQRFKSPAKLLLAPIALPLRVFSFTKPLAPNKAMTCQKVTLTKYDAGDTCNEVQMAKAGWGLSSESTNHLNEEAHAFFNGGNKTLGSLKTFEQFMHDKVAYDLGCAMLADEDARKILDEVSYFTDEYFKTGEAAWVCAGHSGFCGRNGVEGFVEVANGEGCRSECLAEPESQVDKYSADWTAVVWDKMRRQFLTKRPSSYTVPAGSVLPFAMQPYFQVGAVVSEPSEELQLAGVAPGALLTKLNGRWVTGQDYNTIVQQVQGLLRANRAFSIEAAIPRACPEWVVQDILGRPGYTLLSDADQTHFSVGCSDDASQARKVSCDPRECNTDPWCFVPENCGGLFKACEVDPAISLECEEDYKWKPTGAPVNAVLVEEADGAELPEQ